MQTKVVMLMLRWIAPATKQQEINYSSSVLRIFTMLASPSGDYGTLLLLTRTAKKRTLFAGIRVY